MKNGKTRNFAAAVGCAEFTMARRERCGAFESRWFSTALQGAALVLCLLASASGVHAQTTALPALTTVAQRFDAARVEYERNHWPEAYAALSALADSGHAEAARMALQMRQYGPALYGRELVASAGQVALWKRRSGCTGDATGVGCQQALAPP